MTEQALRSSDDREAMESLCPWVEPIPPLTPISDLLILFGGAED